MQGAGLTFRGGHGVDWELPSSWNGHSSLSTAEAAQKQQLALRSLLETQPEQKSIVGIVEKPGARGGWASCCFRVLSMLN